MKKEIVIINQGKTENLGDIAIDRTIAKILNDFGYKTKSLGFAQMCEQTMKIDNLLDSNMISTLKYKIPNIVKWLLKYHWCILKEMKKIKKESTKMVIIGGGQLLKHDSVFIYCLLSWILCLKLKGIKDVYLVGVGLDNNFSIAEKLLYNFLLKKIKRIYLREESSIKNLKKICNLDSSYIPDVVFAYSKYNKIHSIRKKYLTVMIYNYILLKEHFKNKLGNEKYYNEWIDLIKKNYRDDLEIILVYSALEDKIETIKFYNYLQKNTDLECQIINTDTLDKFTNVLEQTKILISGRMHGLILGYNYGCFLVPYNVSEKIENFKKQYLKNSNENIYLVDKITSTFKEIVEGV